MQYLVIALVIGIIIGIPTLALVIILGCLAALLWHAWDTNRLERNMNRPPRDKLPWWWKV